MQFFYRPRRERKVPAHLLKGDFESAFVDRALRKANATTTTTSVTTHMGDAQDEIIMDIKDMPKKSLTESSTANAAAAAAAATGVVKSEGEADDSAASAGQKDKGLSL